MSGSGRGIFQYNIAKITLNKQSEVNYIVKDKTIPLLVWTGPEGSRSLRVPDFKTIGT
jgi:hypothetical protein